jgi:carotenoid cleavage dioxygenase-like enzyme
MPKNSSVTNSSTPQFPRAMMRASAAELDNIEFQLIHGEIPADLHGHLFLVAPVGSVESNGLPNPDNSHVWNGNGLIHRFDLHPGGPIRLTTRLAKTPCYWADLATRSDTPKAKLGFNDWGMARFSLSLGMRNPLNTAFVPMQFKPDEATRLLITFDGGRPYEIDPVTLKVVTPVGGNNEWCAGAKLPLPFQPVLSTAHPAFDSVTSTLFTVNYGRSAGNFLDTIPLLSRISQLGNLLIRVISPLAILQKVLLNPIDSWFGKKTGVHDFVYLLAWDGKGLLRRWQLLDDNNNPICIEQTMHQIGVTSDYVVLADTSLKFGLEQLLPGPLPLNGTLNTLLRKLVTNPQRADTAIYIVRKSDLSSSNDCVKVRSLTLPLETGHFLVDDDKTTGLIVLHAAHECATDVSEWVRPEDKSPTNSLPLDPKLVGMIAVGAMDVGRIGRYVIDAEAGSILQTDELHDEDSTWGIGLYAYRQDDQTAKGSREKITSVFWQSLGFWPDLLSEFIYKLYADYPHRLVPLPSILGESSTAGSRPSTLFRVDTTTMKIVDRYAFPQHQQSDGSWEAWICNSPQFIPRKNKASDDLKGLVDPAIDGWIFCLAISEQSKEVWIFDATNLSDGPICRLAHPKFDPGYTIHTTWLESIHPRSAEYYIDPRVDYDPLLKEVSQEIRDLFAQEVFPNTQHV